MIPIESLHHVSLNVRDLEKSKQFYNGMLGLQEIERPAFDFAGAWFAVGRVQQLHLIVYEGETLRRNGINSRDGHFAIKVRSYKETLTWLESRGLVFDARPYSKAGFPQIYVLDPDNNIIEFNADRCDL
jgi:catechol 2,3-dioxygenase-like lactoylglutathione lyase family enzyme